MRLKLKYRIRVCKKQYLNITKDLENYLDDLSLEDPGDGEEVLEILAKHGIFIEIGKPRHEFITCGVCGGVLFKSERGTKKENGWTLRCLECEKVFHVQDWDYSNKREIRELVREEKILNRISDDYKGEYCECNEKVESQVCGCVLSDKP